MNNILTKKYFNASHIKWIAIVTMLIDHIGATIVEKMYFSHLTFFWNNLYLTCRTIGRIAFPLFAFFIVEGFMHVKNDNKRLLRYLFRLFIFIFISEIPFDLAFNNSIIEFSYQSVYFTLFLGLLAITSLEYLKKYLKTKISNITFQKIVIFSAFIVTICAFIIIANILKTDYSAVGIITIVLLYLLYKHKELGMLLAIMCLTYKSSLEIFAIVDILILWQYNGQRGKQNKFFFYTFYPIHLLILGLLTKFTLV